ncbi:MAG TPA: YraN family protein [Hypericibacter adhaerens]|uniref:YraN family protein n=1 Tax=Hypericibacter adhaerens TaxID=2602016 RepID=UPI002CD2001F|nr:YraN family protein [Hypericibacter adhaerens]HWA43639.1 YraN family protein [Hypericibacter adhaerens]
MAVPRGPDSDRRRAALRRGRWAETLAVWWLRLKGYRILGRDLRLGVGEIDILARRGRLLVAIEVKHRADLLTAGEAIDRRGQARIARALLRWLAQHPHLAELDLRFDAVLMVPGHWPRHLPDAWRPEPD